MIAEGLRLAADTARHQARISRGQGYAETADTMDAFAMTLSAMADAWPEDAPTDPDLEYRVVLSDFEPMARSLPRGVPR